MKKIVSLFLCALLVCSLTAFAEGSPIDLSGYTLEELTAIRDEADRLIAEQPSEEATAEESSEEVVKEDTEETATYIELKKGDKSPEVKALQTRLIELNYLAGGADGDYGNKTATAVTLFQTAVDLPATGVADEATQVALFADDAPAAKVYQSLNYNELERDPNTYSGQNYTFSGKVFQLVGEQAVGDSVYTVLFIATKSSSQNLINVTYWRPANAPRILEGDKVTVSGTFNGLYTYETVSGSSNTILDFTADIIS